jgi:hypothetical protein
MVWPDLTFTQLDLEKGRATVGEQLLQRISYVHGFAA